MIIRCVGFDFGEWKINLQSPMMHLKIKKKKSISVFQFPLSPSISHNMIYTNLKQ